MVSISKSSLSRQVQPKSYRSFFRLVIVGYATIVSFMQLTDINASFMQLMGTNDDHNQASRSLLFLTEGASASISAYDESAILDNNNNNSTATTSMRRIPEEMSSTSTMDSNNSGNSPYSYMMLVGGIHEDKPGYRGFIYNALVAKKVLDNAGSTSDMWLYIQLSPESKMDRLPDEEEDALRALKIQIKYIPKPVAQEQDTFADLVFEKFRALEMTQYRRVMFLDADILPLCNLDYLFHLSDGDRPLIQRNFIHATRAEPANAGFFMLEPRKGAYEEILEIIRETRSGPFNKQNGWGHNFLNNGDQWEGTVQTGKLWNYWAASSDQGLLYYWTKYYEKSVTIFFLGHKVENWVAKEGEELPVIESTMDPMFLDKYAPSRKAAYKARCAKGPQDPALCPHPIGDFAHFFGDRKPWQGKKATKYGLREPYHLFFNTLYEITEEYEVLNITRENSEEKLKPLLGGSPLGYYASRSHFLAQSAEPNNATALAELAETNNATATEQ